VSAGAGAGEDPTGDAADEPVGPSAGQSGGLPVGLPVGGRRRSLRFLRAVLLLAAFGLGVYAVARDLSGFVDAVQRIGLLNGVVALGLVIVGLYGSAATWRACVASTVGALPWGPATQVFFVSQLGKYLPGGLWTVLAQVDAAKRLGLSRSRMGVGAVLFLVFHVLTALLLAALLLPWVALDLVSSYWWSFALVLPLLLALIPSVLTRIIDRGLRLARRGGLPVALRGRDVAEPVGWLAMTWLAYGAALFVLVRPLASDTGAGTLFVVSAGGFALAWVVGVLVVPAPAGLGPREVVLYLALLPVAGAAGATSVAIVVRVAHTLSDLLLAGIHVRRLRP